MQILLLTMFLAVTIIFNHNDSMASNSSNFSEDPVSESRPKKGRLRSEIKPDEEDETELTSQKVCSKVLENGAEPFDDGIEKSSNQMDVTETDDDSVTQMYVEIREEDLEEPDFMMLINTAVEEWDEKIEDLTELRKVIIEKISMLTLTEMPLEDQVEKLHEHLRKGYGTLSRIFYSLSQNETLEAEQRDQLRALGAITNRRYEAERSKQPLSKQQQVLFDSFNALPQGMSPEEKIVRLCQGLKKSYSALSSTLHRLSRNETLEVQQREELQFLGVIARRLSNVKRNPPKP